MSEKEQNGASLDLAKFGEELKQSQEDGIEVVIKHPESGEPIGLKVLVAGPDSERQRKARQRAQNARIRARRMTPLSAAEQETETAKILGESTISWEWSNGLTFNGAVPDLDVETAASLYRKLPFVREQIDMAAADRGGFTKA
jgi:hypothetical protein